MSRMSRDLSHAEIPHDGDQPVLPPIEPPSAGFIMQLFVVPALIVLGLGLPPTTCLVISQVVLSFGIPFALVPLVALTRRADVMGSLVNRRLTTCAAAGTAGLIIMMNVYLLGVTVLH